MALTPYWARRVPYVGLSNQLGIGYNLVLGWSTLLRSQQLWGIIAQVMRATSDLRPNPSHPSTAAFEVVWPKEWAVPLVVSAPHAGTALPPGFSLPSGRAGQAAAAMADAHIDQLARPAAAHLGFPILRAPFTRAFLDLNRAVDELDPLLIEDLPPNLGRALPGSRVAAGLGLVPRLAEGRYRVYPGRLRYAAVQSRIRRFYQPYHRQLAALLAQARTRFGTCLLIDLHSMPPVDPAPAQRALASTARVPRDGPSAFPNSSLPLVLGDNFGRTLDPDVAWALLRFWSNRGVAVAHNRPFAGGHITCYYGQQTSAVQVEVCRSLYPGTVSTPEAKALERLFRGFAAEAARLMTAGTQAQRRQAAE